MNKYDRMLEVNKQASEAKIEKARREIVRMVDDGENVSIQKLMQRTGLSRGFFNKNPQVRKGLTVPWNSRLATIENADQILVIDGGTAVQKGTHKELLEQEGTYREFVRIREQAEGWQIQ